MSPPIAFLTQFEKITDPRIERTKQYPLIEILFAAICATIADADGFEDIARFTAAKLDWFRRFFPFENGAPSHDTFNRVFRRLDPLALGGCVQAWLESLCDASQGRLVSIDGKTLRGSLDKAGGNAALHLVGAWAKEQGIVLGQVATDAKSNEITAVPKLLDMLDLEGAVVSLDALCCQKNIAAAIREKGADYLLALKMNQPTAYEAAQAHFEELFQSDDPSLRQHRTDEINRGRREIREYAVAPAPMSLRKMNEWKELSSIGMVTSTRVVDGKESVEQRFYLCSLAPRVKRFAEYVRGHWGIENGCHWTLDVTFAEDGNQTRKDNGPANLAVLRRLALSLLNKDTSLKQSIRGKRKLAGWNEKILEQLLQSFFKD